MNIFDSNEKVCRICLEPKASLNWNEELFDFCGMTYKDCYYRYTQLNETDADPYSSMLCKTCSEVLKKTHFLIEKALESFRILQQTSTADYFIDEELKDSSCTTTKEQLEEFEIVSHATETRIEHDNDIKQFSELIDLVTDADPINVTNTNLDNSGDIQQQEDKAEISELENETFDAKAQSSLSIPKTKRKKKVMCAYCSLKVADVWQLRKHEETHDRNRERKEVCPHCELKFYSKVHLKSHIMIHTENREKEYKCEFCDKAYFNRGALNVHRRIHLGLMIKCSFCPKEFCRQVDLNRHMASHSAMPLLQVKASKYVVNCLECNSQIPIRRWKAHKASHKNEPQMKCKICNKDFFSRRNCTKHINKMHKKTRDEYETYIHYYVEKSKSRMSHMMLQQFETLQPV